MQHFAFRGQKRAIQLLFRRFGFTKLYEWQSGIYLRNKNIVIINHIPYENVKDNPATQKSMFLKSIGISKQQNFLNVK